MEKILWTEGVVLIVGLKWYSKATTAKGILQV